MYNYKSNRINNWKFIITKWVITSLLVYAALFFLSQLFPSFIPGAINNTFFLLTSTISIFFGVANPDRVNQISINTAKGKIKLNTYSFINGKSTEIYSFDSLRIKNIQKKRYWLFNYSSVILFKGKEKLYEITKEKDGFSNQTLDELINVLESLTTPVNNKVATQ